MRRVFSIIFLFLFLSACGDSLEERGEAKIVNVYEEKFASGRSDWYTTIHCFEDGSRHTIRGKIGEPSDVYMSSHC